MSEDIRKVPIALALRAVVEDTIVSSNLEQLVTFADDVHDAVSDKKYGDWDLKNVLFFAARAGFSQVRGDKETARRLAEARQRRPDETDDDYAARLKRGGLDDE